MKTQKELTEIIKKNASKKLLPDHAIDQLFDINTGITSMLRNTADSLMENSQSHAERAEWKGIFWLTELQLDIQQEIRNRIPDMLTESIDLILNEEGE